MLLARILLVPLLVQLTYLSPSPFPVRCQNKVFGWLKQPIRRVPKIPRYIGDADVLFLFKVAYFWHEETLSGIGRGCFASGFVSGIFAPEAWQKFLVPVKYLVSVLRHFQSNGAISVFIAQRGLCSALRTEFEVRGFSRNVTIRFFLFLMVKFAIDCFFGLFHGYFCG